LNLKLGGRNVSATTFSGKQEGRTSCRMHILNKNWRGETHTLYKLGGIRPPCPLVIAAYVRNITADSTLLNSVVHIL